MRGQRLLSFVGGNVGISEIEGLFKEGDAVRVVDQKGDLIGCGIVNYSHQDLKQAKKKRLQREVIHRDNFVKSNEDWCYQSHIATKHKSKK